MAEKTVKMRVHWDFKVDGYPNFGPGVRAIPESVVEEAKRMGCTFAPDEPVVGEVEPPTAKAEKADTAEREVPAKKAEAKKATAPTEYQKLLKKAKDAGFVSSMPTPKKADLEAFLKEKEDIEKDFAEHDSRNPFTGA